MIEVEIRQDNTWLVVDPIVGCIHDCQYCFLTTHNKTRQKGSVIMTPEQTVQKLLGYWAFKPSSVIMIGSETDIFMNKINRDFLVEFIKRYVDSGIRNIICFSTKCFIPDEFISFIQSYDDLKTIFYISYSGLPKEIEPLINKEKVKSNFLRLNEAKQKIIHFWRPMIPQNSNLETLITVMEDVKGADCSIMRGLNLNKDLQKSTWYWPEVQMAEIDFTRVVSVWPKNLHQNLSLLMKNYPNHPVFFKNSCAISYVFGLPEFSGIFNTTRCLNSYCPSTQREICNNYSNNKKNLLIELVRLELDKIGANNDFVLIENNKSVFVKGHMNHEQIACITQVLGCKVEVEFVESEHEWGGYVLGHIDYAI